MAERIRKLTTIVAIDVAGYSRLMHADETGTLDRLRQARALIDPISEEHGGRIVGTWGDGVLLEFPSVVEAVSAALRVQAEMAVLNADMLDDAKLLYRIGVNLGDVIVEGDDLFGDGVNVAARLEALAEPGGICISRAARDQVRDRMDVEIEDLGEVEVKNIARPVRAFRVTATPDVVANFTSGVRPREPRLHRRPILVVGIATVLAVLAAGAWWLQGRPDVEAASVERMAFALPDRPSIAVLPFDNLSADPHQAYFADGLTDDLITDLSKISGLFVIARNSTFAYKDKQTPIRQVAEELGVRYVLEGSIRRAADEVRINAQLIDALTGLHVWAERYDGSLADVFELQDRVIGQIVAALAVSLAGGETDIAANAETDVPAAYDAFLQGLELLHRATPQTHKEAIGHFERAIALDSGYARAHAGLSAVYWTAIEVGWEVPMDLGLAWQEIFDRAKSHLAEALKNASPLAYQVSAKLLLHHKRFDEAIGEIDRAIALNPNNADSHVVKADILVRAGDAKAAERVARAAMRLNPHYRANYLAALGRSLFGQDRYQVAADVLQRAVAREPDAVTAPYEYLAATYGHLGRIDEARNATEKYDALNLAIGWETLTLGFVGRWLAFKNQHDLERLREGLRKAGVPEGSAPLAEEEVFMQLVTEHGGKFDVDGVEKVDVTAAKALYDSGAVFVDVRSLGAFSAGHIPGSVHLDLYVSLSPKSLGELVGKDDAVVFYCFGEACYRSAHACAKALTWGFSNVYYFASGFPAWKDAGYAVESQ